MKLIASGVTFSAAIVRSPSFSRSSSSTTMIILPARIGVDRVLDRARTAAAGLLAAPLAMLILRSSSMCHFPGPDAERQPRQFRGADHVLADHVAFEVHAVADRDAAAGSCAASVNGTT